jgi:hypothetical protein
MQIDRKERELYLQDTLPGWCRYIRSAIRTTRPARSTRCSASPLLFDRYLMAPSKSTSTPVRRQGRLRRRHHGAHRGSRHPFGRLGLLAAALLALDEIIDELERQTRELAKALKSAA